MSVNQQIADALTEQQLKDARVESQLRREAWAILVVLESEVVATLKANDPTEFALLARRRQEVATLMAVELDSLIQARYAHIARLMDEALMRLATHEAAVVQQVVNAATDEETISDLPSERRLRAGVVHGLFPSAAKPTDLVTTGRDWWVRQGQGLAQRIGDSLTVGVSLEESLTQLTQRARGTSEQGLQDGIMARARDDAARLVRTQTTNAVSEARMAVAERNASNNLIALHQSILDSRTSPQCLGRHGLQYTVPEHHPVNHTIPYLNGPPYHPNCRSVMTIGIRGQDLIMEESLSAWLKRRGAAFQDEVLGPTRARLWRAGTLSPRGLIDAATGRPLTLEELGA
jgi:SPP1 gp7 family putative phage head morphogenesis protein